MDGVIVVVTLHLTRLVDSQIRKKATATPTPTNRINELHHGDHGAIATNVRVYIHKKTEESELFNLFEFASFTNQTEHCAFDKQTLKRVYQMQYLRHVLYGRRGAEIMIIKFQS